MTDLGTRSMAVLIDVEPAVKSRGVSNPELSEELQALLKNGGPELFELLLTSVDARREAVKALEAFESASRYAQGEEPHPPESRLSLQDVEEPTVRSRDLKSLVMARRLGFVCVGLAGIAGGYSALTPGPNPRTEDLSWGFLIGLAVSLIHGLVAAAKVSNSAAAKNAYDAAKAAVANADAADQAASFRLTEIYGDNAPDFEIVQQAVIYREAAVRAAVEPPQSLSL